jgi:hypothetical protein
MRNPFRRTEGRGKPLDALILDVYKGRQRYLERLPDRPTTAVEDGILHNAVVIELGIPHKSDSDNVEGNFVIFLIDEDGFILDTDGSYALPAGVREGNTFADVSEHPEASGLIQLVPKALLESS